MLKVEIESFGKLNSVANRMVNVFFSEYKYVASLLGGTTEKDHTEYRNIIKIFKPHIMDRVSGDLDRFTDYLHEEELINVRDMEEVSAEKNNRGPTSAACMLIDKLQRRHPDWFEILVKTFRRCDMKDIVKLLEITETPGMSSIFKL